MRPTIFDRCGMGCRRTLAELRTTEIADLLRRGYLGANEIADRDAIREALYKHLDRTLDVP